MVIVAFGGRGQYFDDDFGVGDGLLFLVGEDRLAADHKDVRIDEFREADPYSDGRTPQVARAAAKPLGEMGHCVHRDPSMLTGDRYHRKELSVVVLAMQLGVTVGCEVFFDR